MYETPNRVEAWVQENGMWRHLVKSGLKFYVDGAEVESYDIVERVRRAPVVDSYTEGD